MKDTAKSGADAQASSVAKGEFFTDGKTFVFRLEGSPVTGIGDSPDAAFTALMSADRAAGDLGDLLKIAARDQQGEQTRATIVRWTMGGLIAIGVVAGAVVTTAAMTPRVVAAVFEDSGARVNAWIDNLSPEREEKLHTLLEDVSDMIHAADARCVPQDEASVRPSLQAEPTRTP